MRPTFRIRALRSWPRRTAAVAAAASIGCAGVAAAAAGAPGYASAAAIRTAATTTAAAGQLMVAPKSFSVAQGTSEVFGVSLSSTPSANVTVSVSRTSGNSGLTVGSGASLTFTPSNWNYPQPVTVTANASGTGSAAFTATAPGYAAKSVTGKQTVKGGTGTRPHVVNPFTGATWYVNPNYTAEVATSAAGASGTLKSQMLLVGQQPTGVWLDHIGAIYGGPDNSGRLGLAAHLRTALKQASGTKPVLVPIVVYDLPNRDCAALASNGELTVSNNGLQYYEQDYINPIAQILTDFEHTRIRVIAVIEPDSLPNLVTNLGDANCSQANSSGAYVNGVQYALNKLHAIPNVYNYLDIAHSA
jgi:cellulose 1,4-beta-cellobiosidase